MNVRHQVFISSTFDDLKEEREKAFQAVMNLECFPAGMELFPAVDQEQFEYIKRIIDDCDYYVLIIGGRYGSLSSEGISFTEKEYDYAVSKGIPVIALIHDKPQAIPAGKTDGNNELQQQLDAFKKKAQTGRLAKYWNNTEQLSVNLIQSLIHTMKVYPRPGWVKGNTSNNSELLAEINELRKENERNKGLLLQSKAKGPQPIIGLADLSETLSVSFTANSNNSIAKITIDDVSLARIFGFISPYLIIGLLDYEVKGKFGEFGESDILPVKAKDVRLCDSDFQTLQIQFSAMGLISLSSNTNEYGETFLFWKLTESGIHEMYKIKTIKKKEFINSSTTEMEQLPT